LPKTTPSHPRYSIFPYYSTEHVVKATSIVKIGFNYKCEMFIYNKNFESFIDACDLNIMVNNMVGYAKVSGQAYKYFATQRIYINISRKNYDHHSVTASPDLNF
jgi:hypothetical protein